MFIKGRRDDEDGAKALKAAKERERRRRKLIRTKYGQKPLKHARKGIQSCVLAGLVVLLLFFMVSISFASKGEIGAYMGIVGILTAVLSGMGLNLGIRGFKERDKNYITCKVGAGICGIVLTGMAAIFLRGLI